MKVVLLVIALVAPLLAQPRADSLRGGIHPWCGT